MRTRTLLAQTSHTTTNIHNITADTVQLETDYYSQGDFYTVVLRAGGHDITLFVYPDEIAKVIAKLGNMVYNYERTRLATEVTPLDTVEV